MTSPEADEPRSPYPKPYADTPLDGTPSFVDSSSGCPSTCVIRSMRSSWRRCAVCSAHALGQHRVDLRGTVRLWRDHYYFAIVAGATSAT